MNEIEQWTFTPIRDVKDITPAIVDMVVEILSGWYPEGKIDWDDVWDRMEDMPMENGSHLDLGCNKQSLALKALKGRATKQFKEGL
jgi:hypothetical protein